MNTSVTCSYHLYKQLETGEHIFVNNNVKSFVNGRDFEVKILGGNFSDIGKYCHLIECNTSIQTGGIERCFEVTLSENSKNNDMVFLIIAILFSLFIMIFLLAIPSSTERFVPMIFSSLKPVGVYFASLGLLINFYYLLVTAGFGIELGGFIGAVVGVIMVISFLIPFYLVIQTAINIYDYIQEKKKVKSEKGWGFHRR
ncbi:MAG: hypothetical protein IMZ60_02760 [Actinobacteria bacterium]|nr:hypothetical protein [Actinomycetota bacterium]